MFLYADEKGKQNEFIRETGRAVHRDFDKDIASGGFYITVIITAY